MHEESEADVGLSCLGLTTPRRVAISWSTERQVEEPMAPLPPVAPVACTAGLPFPLTRPAACGVGQRAPPLWRQRPLTRAAAVREVPQRAQVAMQA